MPRSVIIQGGELTFNGIKTADQGRYICTARNNYDMTSTGLSTVMVNGKYMLLGSFMFKTPIISI